MMCTLSPPFWHLGPLDGELLLDNDDNATVTRDMAFGQCE
jgi:hypothetical protein